MKILSRIFCSNAILVGSALGVALAACSENGAGPAMPAPGPVTVGVVTLHPQTTPKLMELPGRVVARATAEVRPQVNGIVQEIAFYEGGWVNAGDVLYRLDDKSYVATRDASAAAVKKAEANVAGAQATFDRAQALVVSKTASTQTLDDARSTLLQAQADQEAAEADLRAAEINLGYTEIKAPIAGVISTSMASTGSLVTANQTTAMATIRQVQPIYVDLVDSSANLLKIGEQIKQGSLNTATTDGKPTPPEVELTLETGRPYGETGSIFTTDNAINQSTGTFSIRATFDNAGRVLVPGMYVRASVNLGNVNNVFLVPQRAVNRDAAGHPQAYVVSADGKAEARTLETDGSTATAWIVTKGVEDGDRVVVDGLQRISNGAEVTAIEAQIDENGVVEQILEPPAASPEAGVAKP